MSTEPQPDGAPDKLDKSLLSLKIVWFGLFSGALTITALMVAIVASGGGPNADFGPLNYVFLVVVPLGLSAAYFVAPMVSPSDPASTVRSVTRKGARSYDGWDTTKPDEAYYWFPLYQAQYIVRAAMLEGPAILCAILFFATGEWALLGGALVLLAALLVEVPTRAKVEAFAEAARSRATNAG